MLKRTLVLQMEHQLGLGFAILGRQDGRSLADWSVHRLCTVSLEAVSDLLQRPLPHEHLMTGAVRHAFRRTQRQASALVVRPFILLWTLLLLPSLGVHLQSQGKSEGKTVSERAHLAPATRLLR